MSEKELKILSEQLTIGLELAEQRMLQDKMMKGYTLVVCDENNEIVTIPARNIIDVLWKLFHKNDKPKKNKV